MCSACWTRWTAHSWNDQRTGLCPSSASNVALTKPPCHDIMSLPSARSPSTQLLTYFEYNVTPVSGWTKHIPRNTSAQGCVRPKQCGLVDIRKANDPRTSLHIPHACVNHLLGYSVPAPQCMMCLQDLHRSHSFSPMQTIASDPLGNSPTTP